MNIATLLDKRLDINLLREETSRIILHLGHQIYQEIRTACNRSSGTLTTGSTTFNYGNYNFYIIIGQPTSSSARVSLVVPKSQLTTTATTYQLADETNYYTFNLYYSGSTVTLAYKGRSSSGQILRVFGVN